MLILIEYSEEAVWGSSKPNRADELEFEQMVLDAIVEDTPSAEAAIFKTGRDVVEIDGDGDHEDAMIYERIVNDVWNEWLSSRKETL